MGGLAGGLDDLLRGGGARAAGAGAGGGPGDGGGGLGGLGGLGGILGGILGGAGAAGLGGLLTGGLGDLLNQFQGAGQGDVASSWVGRGENRAISANALSQVLSPDQVDFLQQHSGLSREELMAGLSEQLPHLIDQLTPDGRMPTADEMNRTV